MADSIKTNDSNIYVNIDALRKLQFFAKGFNFLPNQPVNSVLSGKNASRLRGRGLNFEELRHYRPGDDIRSMDWKVTKRTGKPHIKVYTEERERNVYLAIDQRSTMFFGSTEKMKSVMAAELSALIAWQINGSGDRIGAVIYGDDDVHVVPAKRGYQHVVQLLSEVVKFNRKLSIGKPKNNPSRSFNNMLAKLSHVCGNNALVMLISDGYGWNDNSVTLVKKLRQHHEVIACHIGDPLERQLPTMHQMVVSDGSYQIQFSSQDKVVQQKFEHKLSDKLSEFTRTAKKYRIPLISIDTVSPVEVQLRKALGTSVI